MVRVVSVGGLARRVAAAVPAVALATTAVAFVASSAGPDTGGVSHLAVPDAAITEPASPAYPMAGPAPAPMQLPPIYDTYVDDPSRQPVPGQTADATRAISPLQPVRLDAHGIPAHVLAAYQSAADLLKRLDPGCGLDWALLGAIGRVESNHARFGGNVLDAAGIARPGIIGIPLDGSRGTARISDTDDGRWDRDSVFDRAVGPMQFIPGTWRISGRDGDGDGVANPQDLFDAATSAGVYLCSGPGDLRKPDDANHAVLRYNRSDEYARTVLSIANAYRTGVEVLPVGALPAARPASGTGSDTPDGSGFAWGGSPTAPASPGRPTPTSPAFPSQPTGAPTNGATGTPAPKPTASGGSSSSATPVGTTTSGPLTPRLPLPRLPLPSSALPSLPSLPTISVAELLALPHLPRLFGDPLGLVRVLDPLTATLTCVLDNEVVRCPGLLG